MERWREFHATFLAFTGRGKKNWTAEQSCCFYVRGRDSDDMIHLSLAAATICTAPCRLNKSQMALLSISSARAAFQGSLHVLQNALPPWRLIYGKSYFREAICRQMDHLFQDFCRALHERASRKSRKTTPLYCNQELLRSSDT